jgi:hypothetical protein
MKEQNLAACSPHSRAANSNVLLVGLFGLFRQITEFDGNSVGALKFQRKMRGSAIMYSTPALGKIREKYCRMARDDSVFDVWQLDNGEDTYLLNLVQREGFNARVFWHVHATTFEPDVPIVYIAQQVHWKRSEMAADMTFFFDKAIWAAWSAYGQPLRLILWAPILIYRGIILNAVGLASAPLTMSFALLLDNFISKAGYETLGLLPLDGVSYAIAIHAAMWLCLALYCMAAAGSTVMERPRLHSAAFFIHLACGCVFGLLLVFHEHFYRHWLFWVGFLAPLFILFLRLCGAAVGNLPLYPIIKPFLWLPLFWIYMPAMWFVHCQCAALCYASSDCLKSGSGVRGSSELAAAETAPVPEDAATQSKVWTRRILLTSWLIVNFSIGQVILAFSLEKEFFEACAKFILFGQMLTACLCMAYLLQMTQWSYFRPTHLEPR